MARIWARIMTALRGGASEAADSVIARQALRVLDQEIRDAEQHISSSRSSLAGLICKTVAAAGEVARTDERLASLIENAEMALAAGREDLALEIAGQISRLEPLRVQDARIAQEYSDLAYDLRAALQTSESKLKDLKAKIEVVRTTAQVQQARAMLSCAGTGSMAGLQAAADSLDEIRQRQMEAAARLQVQEEILAGDSGLERRLREAGITPDSSSAHVVLARIKANFARTV